MKRRFGIGLIACVAILAGLGGALLGSAPGALPPVRAQTQQRVILPLVYKNYEVPPSPATYFGIWLGGGDTRDVHNLREAGAGWAIVHLSWARVQPTSSSGYDFSAYDTLLGELTSTGIRPIVQIRDNPAWAASTPCGPITDLNAFATFVSAAVTRYKAAPYNVKYWEFYNEPDYRPTSSKGISYGISLGGCWGDDPIGYTQMLQRAAGVIRPLDGSAKILLGGLAHEDTGLFNMNFLDQVIGGGGANYFDIANVHYFSSFSPAWGRTDVIGKIEEIRRILNLKGAIKPIALTELSYTDWGEPFAQAQASYVGKVLARALYASSLDPDRNGDGYPDMYVPIMTWFSLDWDGTLDPAGRSVNYGLLDSTGTPRPAYWAFRTAARELGKTAIVYGQLTPQDVGVSGGIEGYAFGVEGEQRWILWASPDGSSLWITLPARVKAAYDRAGQAISLNSGSPTSLLLTDSPIYVRLNP